MLSLHLIHARLVHMFLHTHA